MLRLVALLACVAAAGCSLIRVEQQPFNPLVIRADRPPPKPARVVLTESSIQIKEKVQFELGSATLLEASFGLLNEVAQILKDNEQIESVRVEGHTDSTGSKGVNKKLSQQRADSVKTYLVGQGVAAKRIVAKGFGPDKPIAPNETEEGRDANRRVEFNIVKQGPKKTLVQDE